MPLAEEIFTIELARAAGRQANRFLHARGLQKSDRDDVISAALLWCWENRANYSLTTTLETWFMNAVRDAYKNLSRDEGLTAEESMATLSSGDETYHTVAAQSSADALLQALTPVDKEIALLTMAGHTYREIWKRGYPKRAIDDAHQRVKQLRKFLPEPEMRGALRRASATPRTPNLDEQDTAQVGMSSIDIEIEQLDFAPPAGKQCPPCWRCLWFEGYMPDGKRSTRLEIADIEVRAAVSSTEARKIEIAQQVRSRL